MKVSFKVRDGFLVEFDAKEQSDVFEQLASMQDVFGEKQCGLCGKGNLRFQVRNVDDNHFYEIVCQDCGGKLYLSKNKKGGTLYPVRKLKNGLPAKAEDKEGPFDFKTKGWHRWERDKQQANKPKK